MWSQYNALVDTLTRVSGYKGADATQPALFGDATTRGIASRLRVELGRDLSGLDGAFSSLSEIGIATGTDGKLTLDTTALNAALAKDSAGVGELFGSADGFATRIGGLIDSYVKTGGILEARTTGLQGRLDRIDDSRESLDRRLTALEARYKKQFTAMDTLVGQLQSTSSFLTQQFAALNSSTRIRARVRRLTHPGVAKAPIDLITKGFHIMTGLSALRAYRNVSAQSALVDSSPHQLILMLIDGAIAKTAGAIGHMRHGETAEKGRLISGSIAILDSLRGSLNHEVGGELAGNLDRLYDYMSRRLLEANIGNDAGLLGEVVSLLKEVRDAWDSIPQEYRGAGGVPAAGSMLSFSRQ